MWYYELIQCRGTTRNTSMGVVMASEDIINKLVEWVTLWADTMQGHNQEYIHGCTNGIWGYYKQTSSVCDIMNWYNAGAQPGIHTWGTNGIWGYYKQTSSVGVIMNWYNAGAQPGIHTWGTNGIWVYYKQTSSVCDIMNWYNAGAQPGIHTWGY